MNRASDPAVRGEVLWPDTLLTSGDVERVTRDELLALSFAAYTVGRAPLVLAAVEVGLEGIARRPRSFPDKVTNQRQWAKTTLTSRVLCRL